MNEFVTKDLGEAAALIYIGFPLIGVQSSNNPRKQGQKLFVFPRDHEDRDALDVVNDYQRHKLSVDAFDFFVALKETKVRLYSAMERVY